MRAAMARALDCQDQLKPRDLRVLLGVFQMTASYSRLEERCSASQIGDVMGVSRPRASESLGRLNCLRVIGWHPGGLNTDSRVSLVDFALCPHQRSHSGYRGCPASGDSPCPASGDSPEKTSEKTYEKPEYKDEVPF